MSNFLFKYITYSAKLCRPNGPARRGNAELIKKFIIKPEYTNLDEIRDLGPDLAQIFYPDIMIIKTWILFAS